MRKNIGVVSGTLLPDSRHPRTRIAALDGATHRMGDHEVHREIEWNGSVLATSWQSIRLATTLKILEMDLQLQHMTRRSRCGVFALPWSLVVVRGCLLFNFRKEGDIPKSSVWLDKIQKQFTIDTLKIEVFI